MTAWSNAIEDYTDASGVISGVPTARVGDHENECPLCRHRVPSEGLDDDGWHAAGCNWRKLVRAQRNFERYGVHDPFDIDNGEGRLRLTVTYELDVSFVSDMALERALTADFTDPSRAVALAVTGSITSWHRGVGEITNIEWLERTEPQERT